MRINMVQQVPTSAASLSWRLFPPRSKVWEVSSETQQDETERRWVVAHLSSCWSAATSSWLRGPISCNWKLQLDNRLVWNQSQLTCCHSRFWRWPAAWARSAHPAVACRTGFGNATRWGRTSCPALSWTSRACRPADTSQDGVQIQYCGPLCEKLITDWGTNTVKLWCRFLGFLSISVFHNQSAFLRVASQLSNANQYSKTWLWWCYCIVSPEDQTLFQVCHCMNTSYWEDWTTPVKCKPVQTHSWFSWNTNYTEKCYP